MATVLSAAIGPAAAGSQGVAGAKIERISVSTQGHQGDGGSWTAVYGDRTYRQITPDGTNVVFVSGASNLVADDTNDGRDIFVHDRQGGGTYRANVTSQGQEVPESDGFVVDYRPSISDDGRYVAFSSVSRTLVPGDQSEWEDLPGRNVFVKDLVTGHLELVTPPVKDYRHPNWGGAAEISGNGRYVVFWGEGLWADPDKLQTGIFIYDRQSGSYRYIRGEDWGCPDNDKTAAAPRINGAGDKVVFYARGCTPGSGSLELDIGWLWDAASGSAKMVTIDESGEPIEQAGYLSLSDDGRFAVFTDRYRTGRHVVYVRDLQAGITEVVSQAPNGELFDADAMQPHISADGRFVAFMLDEYNKHIFVRDRELGTTERITPKPPSGFVATAAGPLVSADGCNVAFWSSQSYLVDDDTNGTGDVFVSTGGTSWCGDPPVESTVIGTVLDGHSVADEHGNGLDGVEVELRQNGETKHGPTATSFGSFRFGGVEPGDYRLRVTLSDATREQPLFDIRHSENATGAAWIEVDLEVDGSGGTIEKDIFFSKAGKPAAVSPDIPRAQRDRLDDLANIFYRMNQYVRWLDEELSAALAGEAYPAPVEIYAFSAESHPENAFYRRTDTTIHIGHTFSAYAARDGWTGVIGPFVEWHEFTHHIARVNIDPVYDEDSFAADCANSRNHMGYANPSTCDSFNEGLAHLMPTLFYNKLNSRHDLTAPFYPVFGVNFESNALDAWTAQPYFSKQENKTKYLYREEFAFSALVWDLIDAYDSLDEEFRTKVKNEDVEFEDPSEFVTTTLVDEVEVPFEVIWDAITKEGALTVKDLRDVLYASASVPTSLKAITVDLDDDGTADVSQLDVPFIMHGFFPRHSGYYYVVNGFSFWDIPGQERNRAVSWSNSPHPESKEIRGKRHFTERLPTSYIELDVIDPKGGSLSASTALLTIEYPEGAVDVEVPLRDGENERIYLELPVPHLGAVAEGEDLPSCDEASEYSVNVSVSAIFGGASSKNRVQIDNCEYTQAVATATDDTGLEATLKMPAVKTRTNLKVMKKRRAVVASGALIPTNPGAKMTILLQQRKGKKWKTIATRRALLGPPVDGNSDGVFESRYRGRLKRPGRGKCRIVARWKGDASHKPSGRNSKAFRC